jgi:Cys-tRNA(Pro)/Cys-tRNA(Cys) deacylase
MTTTKTNALRMLDQLHINYELRSYSVDEHLDAKQVATSVGLSYDMVYKTLVTSTNTKEIIVFVIQADSELPLKLAAHYAQVKALSMVPLKDLTMLTGYQRGGCSPIGMKKLYRTFIDSRAQDKVIAVSAGKVGLQMLVSANELLNIIKGKWMVIPQE